MRLFVSLFAYAFGKQHWPNVEAATAWAIAQGESCQVPGFRTLHRLRKFVDEVELHTDHSTLIARARDRAAGRFLRGTCEQWIAIDDDVDADDRACVSMLTTKSDRILSAAMRMRSGDRDFNISVNGARSVPMSQAFPVVHVGMGLVRFPRAELARVVEHSQSPGEWPTEWDEPSPDVERRALGIVDTSPGVFLPFVKDRRWFDDDWSFCERAAAAGVEVWSIVLPGIKHAGISNVSRGSEAAETYGGRR